jgi:hypothetical protein
MQLFQQIDTRTFTYRVDARGRLSAVNDAWLAFANENDWPVRAADVIDRPLMDFIEDPQLRYLYGLLMSRLRTGHGPFRFRYRCDAPDCRRLMEMNMLYDTATREIEFQSRVLRIERRPAQELLRVSRPTHEQVLRICSCCKRVGVGDRWAELEDAIMQLRLFDCDQLPRTRHCICRDCAGQLAALANSGSRLSPRRHPH